MKNLNKKRIIVMGICIIVLIIGLIFIVLNKGKKNNLEEKSESSLHLYTHQVIDIEDLDTSLYASSKSKIKDFKIASKYKVGKEAYTFDADVDMYLDNNMAKVIYIRDDNIKLNIVQLKYELKHDVEIDETTQVEEMMRKFEMECKSNMGLMDLEQKPDEVNISDDIMPYSEKIYINKELYSARYVVKEDESSKTYDINYYMDGDDTLVCEFVKL